MKLGWAMILLGVGLAGPGDSMTAEWDPSEFLHRRQQVLRDMPEGVLLVRSTTDSGEAGFQGSRDFFYLTGIEQDGGVLLLAPGGIRVRGTGADYYGGRPSHEVLFLPEAGARELRWDGPRLGPGAAARELSGIEPVHPLGELERVLGAALPGEKVLYFSAPAPLAMNAPPGESLGYLKDLRERYFWLEVRDAGRLIHPLRMAKSPAEITRIERAVDLTGEGINEVLAAAGPGMRESEVEGILGRRFLAHGARFAFPTIVGSGGNSTILHYKENREVLEAGDIVVLDVGARVDGYASDISRTFPVSGRFSPRQAEIYRLVLGAQRAGIEAVRPGATLDEVHRAAFRFVEAAGYGEFFVHGTTHHLGLDVHDVGDLQAPLPAGAVITVEPGIYLPEEKLGVRIEDDVLVTESGRRVLSEAIPKELEAIESAMTRP
jgi:Xaa-Pro aminopeptidase